MAKSRMNTNNSTITQKIRDLVGDLYDEPLELAIAVIRSLTELDEIKGEAVGPCDDTYGSHELIREISMPDYNYSLATIKKRTQTAAHRALTTIADSLETNYNA